MSETEISRVTRSRQRAKASYDRMSKWYDVIAGSSEKKYRELGLSKLKVQEGEKVLEIGFGTGHCIVALATLVGDTGSVYGVDISEGMRDIAARRAVRAGLADRIRLEVGDAVETVFENNFFDAILMTFTLELFDTPEIPIVLDKCLHALKSSGRICVVAMSKGEKSTLALKIYEWAHERIPNYVDCRPIFAQRALEDAGFRIADATIMSMWGLPVEIVLAYRS